MGESAAPRQGAPLYRDFMTGEDLDAQYQTSRSVPDSEAYARDYASRSAKTRRRLRCALDVRYGESEEERLDIFHPRERNGPVVMFFHGGYWRKYHSEDFSFVAEGLIKAGATVMVVNYSLCPAVTLTQIVNQQRAAVAWAYAHAGEHDADGSRLFVAGHSAGGHAAVSVLVTDWAGIFGLPGDVVKGALAVSGVYDLRPLPFTFLQPVLQLSDEEVRELSLIDRLPSRIAPLLISYGAAESAEFSRQSAALYESCRRRNLPVRLLPALDRNHYDVVYDLATAGSPMLRAFVELIVPTPSTRGDADTAAGLTAGVPDGLTEASC